MIKLIKTVLRPFLTGVLALLPLALTVVIVAWLADVIMQLVGPSSAIGGILQRYGWNIGASETGAYFGGALFAIALIYAFGLLVQAGLRTRWEKVTDSTLLKLPLVGTIYDAAKKMSQILEQTRCTLLQL